MYIIQILWISIYWMIHSNENRLIHVTSNSIKEGAHRNVIIIISISLQLDFYFFIDVSYAIHYSSKQDIFNENNSIY